MVSEFIIVLMFVFFLMVGFECVCMVVEWVCDLVCNVLCVIFYGIVLIGLLYVVIFNGVVFVLLL